MRLKPGSVGEVIALHMRDRTVMVAVRPGVTMSSLLHADLADAAVVEEAFRSGFRAAAPQRSDERQIAEDAAWRSFSRELPGREGES